MSLDAGDLVGVLAFASDVRSWWTRMPRARWCLEFNRSLHSRAQAADDLFALGVTACRLVTGQYPQLAEPRKDEHGLWHVDSVVPPAALLKDERIEPRLRTWILRLLSVRPEERGTAAQLAEALEQDAARPLADTSGDGGARRGSHVHVEGLCSPQEPKGMAESRSWTGLGPPGTQVPLPSIIRA